MLLHNNFGSLVNYGVIMTGSLYLTPNDPAAAPPTDRVLPVLQRLGIIGARIAAGRFLAGDQLVRYITFAGCSPQLRFEPPAEGGNDFCHVELLGPYAVPRMLSGPHTLNPRCPGCNRRAADWRSLEAAWLAAPGTAEWTCEGCGTGYPVTAWRWRRHALFGHTFVAIRSVFPSEAVPEDRLLQALQEATGIGWDYGWAAS